MLIDPSLRAGSALDNEISSSIFPIDRSRLRRLLRNYGPLFGPGGPYFEFVYQRKEER